MDILSEGAPQQEADIAAAQRFKRLSSVRSAVSWMMAIGAFTLVNLAGAAIGFPARMVVGLTFTQLLMGMFWERGSLVSSVALILSLVAGGGCFALAWGFRQRGYWWAALALIILYTCDAVLALLLRDVIGAGFHVLALYFMIRGYIAFSALLKERRDGPAMQPVVQPAEAPAEAVAEP